ncbi:MAG: serine/threonine-protein kinase [Kiritimatiellae bacterium]|nr:serine/threonine-protein kinase [Kiritimatiellia bacterium]
MTIPEIPGLRCVALLHESGNYSTWKAVQTSLDRFVNVRIFHQSADTAAAAQHFLAMSRVIASLKHTGIAQILDVVADAPEPYVVMEHVEGASLAEMVAATGPMSTATALRLTAQLVEALDHAWTHARLVLRSLKPQNLRVNAQGQLKIYDFSLAVQIHEGLDLHALDEGMVVGTLNYLAPEQVQLSPTIDFRTDMYALGGTLYYMVTGKTPFDGLEAPEILRQQISGQIPYPRTLNPRLSAQFCAVIARLMMKDASDRYATWQALSDDLRLLSSSRHPPHLSLPDGISTVARPAGAKDRGAASAAGSGRDGSGGAHRRGTRLGALYLLLLIWFAWLANYRLDNPLALPGWLTPAVGGPHAPAAPSIAPSLSAPAGADAANVPDAVAAVTEEKPGGAVAAAPADSAGTNAVVPDTARVSAGGPSDELLRALGQALARGDLDAARQILNAPSAGAGTPGVAALREAIAAIPDVRKLVEAGLLAQRGKQVTISYLGRERTIVPRTIVSGELHADFIAPDGSARPVSFKTERLDAAERLRWVPSPTTPGEHAAICILALQAGDGARLAAHLEAAGALAPVFRAVRP